MRLAEELKQLLQDTESERGGAPGGIVRKQDLHPELRAWIAAKRKLELTLPTGAIIDVPDADQIPAFLKILDDVLVGNNVWLYGPAGTGKTTLAKKVANTLLSTRFPNKDQYPFVVINCNQWTSPIDLIGGQTIEGYKEGRLIDAWREGKILILDEITKLDPNTAGIVNDALALSDKSGKDSVIYNGDGKAIEKHPDFGCIAAANTTGRGTSASYGGNNKQDASLLDRFSSNFYEIGFNKELEQSLVAPKVFEIADQIRDQLIRLQSQEIMSLRTMLQLNKIYLLEMERETGKKPKVKGGKTLKDALDNYFGVMPLDQANQIKEEVKLDAFLHSYKDREAFLDYYTAIT